MNTDACKPVGEGADAPNVRLNSKMTAPWMPIETAPKDGTLIDLWVDGEREANCKWARGSWLTLDDGCWAYVSDPTHWMPLPPPPLGAGT